MALELKTREFKPTEVLEFLESKNCDPLALDDILGMVHRLTAPHPLLRQMLGPRANRKDQIPAVSPVQVP